MKCACPKCKADIEVLLPEVAEEGTATKCPACQAGFWVHKESFGGRALRRTGEISCASCGEPLGPQMHCAHCGVPYPEYLISTSARKKAGQKAVKIGLSSPFKRVDRVTHQLPPLDGTKSPAPPAAAKTNQASAGRFSRGTLLAVSALVLLALSAAGAGIYLKKKAETKYIRNFAFATYGIQVGIDTSRNVCLRMADEWKAGVAAGKAVSPRPTAEDEKALANIKTKLATAKKNLAEEPEKFKECSAEVAKFEGSFQKMHALAMTPGDSLPSFTNSINKLDGEYAQAAKEFKASIPAELMEELVAASQKYRGLRPLLN